MYANNIDTWLLDSTSVLDSSSVEKLTNGGFDSNPALTGWTVTGSSGCNGGNAPGLTSGASCYSGSCFTDQCSWTMISLEQNFSATAGQTYRISFWVYLKAGNGNGSGTSQLNVAVT